MKTGGTRQFSDLAKVVYAISGSSDQLAGDLALVDDTPMFMSENSTYKIFATRLDDDGNFVWPGNRVEISSSTAPMSKPKMRYGFTPDGPDRCAGTWTEDRGTGYKGYAQGISVGGLIGITVATQNGVPAIITTDGGTLQMVSTVFPSSADQSVTWSIVPGTGMATISTTGLVTAVSNGTAYAKATAVQDTTVWDTLMITMSGQSAMPPTVVTLPATDITSSSATLNGMVNANTLITDVSFEWGLTSFYGNTIAAIPPTVSGTLDTPVLAYLNGLQSNTTYHFRVMGSNLAGTSTGDDLTFTTSVGVGIDNKEARKMEIYPVPNDGEFNISVSSGTETTFTLEVYDNLGSKIFSNKNIKINGTCVTGIDLRPVSSGLYTVIIRNNANQVVRKILVNK